jgi:hypothetical protein
MNNDFVIDELRNILKERGIDIKYGRGYFEGGICRYKDNQYLYLNRAQDVGNHISLIISEMKKMKLENLECSPEVKSLLEKTESN